MTPPEHLFIGLSLGNTVYASLALLGSRVPRYAGVLLACGVMALLPDIDSFFGHYASRNVFVGHRGITHSLFFMLIVSMIAAVMMSLPARWSKRPGGESRAGGRNHYMIPVFVISTLAGLSHLIADLPQPPGQWGGIPLFFPLRSDGEFVRTGGWAMIGWYDYQVMWSYLFLFLASLALMGLYGIMRGRGFRKTGIAVALCVILLNFSMYAWTVRHIGNSGYGDFAGWNRLQERRLDVFGPAVKAATLKGRDRFLEVFHRIR